VFPTYEWLPWKFASIPKNYWDDVNNQIKFINWAGKELKIKEMSDWYNVSYKVGKSILSSIQFQGFGRTWWFASFK
jgi:hypothetical protein